jgi:hypothetical protein
MLQIADVFWHLQIVLHIGVHACRALCLNVVISLYKWSVSLCNIMLNIAQFCITNDSCLYMFISNALHALKLLTAHVLAHFCMPFGTQYTLMELEMYG